MSMIFDLRAEIPGNPFNVLRFSFEGLPRYRNHGDVAPDAVVFFSLALQRGDDRDGYFRRYVNFNQQFAGKISGQYASEDFHFIFGGAKLTKFEPAADGSTDVFLTFEVRRQNISEMRRPNGQIPRTDNARWEERLQALCVSAQSLKIDRSEVEAAEAAIARKRDALTAKIAELRARKELILATAPADMLVSATARLADI